MVYAHEWKGKHANILAHSCKNKSIADPTEEMDNVHSAIRPFIDFICDTRGIPDTQPANVDDSDVDELIATTQYDIGVAGAAYDAQRPLPRDEMDDGNLGSDAASDSDADSDTLTDDGDTDDMSPCSDGDADGDEDRTGADPVDHSYEEEDGSTDDECDERDEAEQGTDEYHSHSHVMRTTHLHVQEWIRRANLEPDEPDRLLTDTSTPFTERQLHECRDYLDDMVVGELDHGGAQLFIT